MSEDNTQATPGDETAELSSPGGDAAEIWRRMRAIYAHTLAGDVAASRSLMHSGITLWDSEIRQLAHGVADLQRLRGRDELAPEPKMPDALDACEPVVTVWDDTALLRHTLTVRFDGQTPIDVRNTSVWRREGGQWLLAHNHEDTWVTHA